jgi:aldehyde:ferredoxin oxidoreductase
MGLASIVHAKTKQSHSATYWSNDVVSLADTRRDAERMGLTEEELDRVFTEDSFDTGRHEKYGGEAETTYNALGICSTAFHWLLDPTRDMPWLAEVYSATTGFDMTPRELLRAGERVYNLEKLLNVREGFTREDDRIPPVYLENTEVPIRVPGGDSYLTDWFGKRLTREDLKEMLDHYYEERGWDIQKGVPTRKRLIELGLEEFVEIVDSVS